MDQKKEIQINDEIIKKTICKKEFYCLSGNINNICRVELNVENKIYFVKCIEDKPCNHRRSFGYSFLCLCPVRKEIFNLYGI